MASKTLEHFLNAEQEAFNQLLRIQDFIRNEGGEPKYLFSEKNPKSKPLIENKEGGDSLEYQQVYDFLKTKNAPTSKSDIKKALPNIDVGRSLRYLRVDKKMVECIGSTRNAKWRIKA